MMSVLSFNLLQVEKREQSEEATAGDRKERMRKRWERGGERSVIKGMDGERTVEEEKA